MALDFRALRYFVAVAEELHFTRAAERMYIAQPALSEQIRRLESELGVELLRRTTRRVQLTAAGEEFLTHARAILREADEALAGAARAARGETGRLRVGTGATAGVTLVAEILRTFAQQRPQVRIDLRQLDWEDYFGGLAEGELDAAFVWRPVDHDGLSAETVHEEPRLAALAAGHPLADGDPVDVDRLLVEPWPTVETRPAALAFWNCEDLRGGPAPPGPAVRSMEGMLEAVRAGLCVATVPASQAHASGWPGIVFRRAPRLAPATLALVWRTGDETPALGALVDVARRAAAATASTASAAATAATAPD